jgi:hypothetical protein
LAWGRFKYHHVGSLGTTVTGLDGELYLVALVQRTRAPGTDARVVAEYVFTLFAGDETVALAVTEPLNGTGVSTLFHSCSTLLSSDSKVRLCLEKLELP